MSDTLLTQEEIDALLSGASNANGNQNAPAANGNGGGGGEGPFSGDEIQALKDFFSLLANGSASVLLTLANNDNAKCELSTVKASTAAEVSSELSGNAFMEMEFNEGIVFKSGVSINNQFLLDIASMMLGGAEVDALAPEYISACEAFFDQIFGSVVMLWKNKYDIAARYVPPKIEESADITTKGLGDEILSIVFDIGLNEENVNKINILLPNEEAKKILSKIMVKKAAPKEEPAVVETATESESGGGDLSQDEIDALLKQGSADVDEEEEEEEYDDEDEEEEEEVVVKRPAKKKKPVSPNAKKLKRTRKAYDEDVSPVDFADIEEEELVELPSNIDLLLDVPLEITVELGRTKMLVKDILELGTGSVIELQRLAGESIDVLVNGKLIAKGEVVVIDENFGIRITSIVSPHERLAKLK